MELHNSKISLIGLSPEETKELFAQYNIDQGYETRLLYWIYKRAVRSLDAINDIPKRILAEVEDKFTPGIFSPHSSVKSADSTVKYLFRNSEGLLFESVFIPDGKRNTLCISVQSGCRMGCSFCATGSFGWHGNLTAGEIVNQVISVPHDISNIVFMGMGEPCDNIEEVIKACKILTAEWGLAKGRANITVSTVGVMPELKRLLRETNCNITLSLHSPFPEERAAIVPAERISPSHEIIEVIKNFSTLPRRRFTVAYVMIEGVNDTERHLEALGLLLKDSDIRINLIPYHPFEESRFVSSSAERMKMFKHLLVTSGIGASVRKSRGADVSAACGMLAALNNVKDKKVI